MDRYDAQQQPAYDTEPRLSPEQSAALNTGDHAPESITDPTLTGGPTTFDAWQYRDENGIAGAELVGYKVEAVDGGIGKIDSDSREVGSSYLVVDTGPWIFGRKVMLPAGVVERVDHDERKVYVDRSKDQIKAAPEFDDASHADPAYRDKLGGYYGDSYNTPGGSYATPDDTPGGSSIQQGRMY